MTAGVPSLTALLDEIEAGHQPNAAYVCGDCDALGGPCDARRLAGALRAVLDLCADPIDNGSGYTVVYVHKIAAAVAGVLAPTPATEDPK